MADERTGRHGDAGGDARADKIRIGISGCLLGERVRWNGDHKRDAFLVETVGRFVEYVSVCPEAEIGLGIPRPPLHLERVGGKDGGGARLVEIKSGRDLTATMDAYSVRRVQELRALDLCGYILKKDSPSCGLERVKVWDKSQPSRTGVGRFAAALVAALPDLPVEEEGRLCDPQLRENFFERVFAWRRLAALFAPRWTRGAIVAFHAREKLLLLAHHPEGYRELGRIVAAVKGKERGEFERAYRAGFMAALKKKATARRHVNALQHMAGYVSDDLDVAGRKELVGAIEDFGRGLIPLVVPMTLLKHHVRRLGVEYLAQQTYLDPHPKELMLRNHV